MREHYTHTGRFLRTVSHLRAGQIVDRIAKRFARTPRLDGAVPPMRVPAERWKPCQGRASSLVSPCRFRFHAHEAALGELSGWNDPSLSKLWLYNLQYFDDLLAEGASERAGWHEALIARWIEENPPASGNGWEPYPLSRRIVNWICWQLSGNELPQPAVESLAKQVRALEARLEYHLLGNHLFANAKALVFAGAFFEGEEPRRWLRRGLSILENEVPEQISRDGGHFELSPMYHALILEDVLDLLQLDRVYPGLLRETCERQAWRERASSMLDWLAAMSHPDGGIAFFNDAAFGQGRTHQDLDVYAQNLDVRGKEAVPACAHFRDTGYIRLVAGPWAAFFDAAHVGPAYLPGHAHADTLSMELSYQGQRLITNGGVSTYATGPMRDLERSTANHATVEIDGHDSSEVWAGFRVGRRARSSEVTIAENEDGFVAEASHDGYRFLAGRPVHKRTIDLRPEGVSVRDLVSGGGRHAATGRFPLHPSVKVEESRVGWRITTTGDSVVTVSIEGSVERKIEQGYFAPEFGVRLPRPVLTWRAEGALPIEVTVEFRT